MKKTITSVFLILNTIGAFINAQTTSWTLPFKPNSTSNNVNVTDVEFDASGNVFATGSFRGTVNFNFNGTATNITSAGGHDVFLAMYNPSGILQWVKTIGGTLDDAAVALDVQGTNLVIAGTFVSTNVDFDPGAGTNVLSSSGLTDIFVTKFDNTGNHIWAKRSGGAQGELVTDVEFDGNSNVFVAGSFTTINDFFSNTNTLNIGARDAFVCKLDAAGVYQWVKVVGGAGTDVSNKLTVFGNNQVLLCVDIGYSSSSTTFDPGSGTPTFTFSGTSGTNGIVSDFNSAGAYGNTLHFKGNSHMVKMLAQNNENIGIGTFSGTMDIDPTAGVTNVTATGASDMFMVQTGFATGGSFIAHGTANGIGSLDAVYPTNAVMKVGINYQTDLYITGYAKGAVNFGGTAAADIQGTTAGDCSFEVKYNHDFANNNDFQLLYAHRNASAAGVPSGNENSHGNGIALNAANGDVIIGGYYSSASTSPKPVVFNPGNVSVTQTFATASMGFVQYINGCSTPTVTAASNKYTICTGATATITASGATTYSWNTGSTAASFTVAGNTVGTTIYTLTGYNGSCSDVDTVKITVNATPTVVASGNAYSYCNGSNVTLTAAGATTYSWNTGSTSASFTVAPNTVTIYTVTGTTNGCSKTDTVKITPKATPTTVATSNPNTAVCSGITFTLQGSGASTYTWTGGPSTAIYTVVPTSSRIYTVTGTGTSGCTKTATVAVSVNTASVTSTAPDFRCGPGTVVLGATTAAGTLEWYSASTGGSPLTTGTSFTTPSISGTTIYYVGVNNGGCISAARSAVTATVKTIPTIPTSANNFVRCGTGTLSINASPGSIGSVFWYSSPTSSGVLSSTANYTTPSLTSTTVYYAATASGGCYSPRLAVSAVIQNAAPTVAPSNSTPGANLTICSGNTSTLSATVAAYESVKWYSVPTAGTVLASSNTYTTLALTTNTVFYAETNNTCGAGPRTAITVTVSSSPVSPSNTTLLNNQKICSGNTTTVSATASGSVKWYTALTGGTLLTTNSNYITPVLTNNTTYYAENLSSCGTSTRTAVTVTVNALPNVTAASNSAVVCSGITTSLTANGAVNYTWNTTETNNVIIISPNITTTYTVTGVDANGCSKAATVTQSVNPLPVVNASSNNPLSCSGLVSTLTATGATSYSWSTTETTSAITVSPNITTTYTVTGIGTNGCSDVATVTQYVSVCTDLNNIDSSESSFSIYPNPTNGILNIELKTENDNLSNTFVSVTNTLGQVFIKQPLINQFTSFSVFDLPAGLYFISILESNRIIKTEKILKNQ